MARAPFGFAPWPVVPTTPDDEATPVGLAPGQMPVDPRRDGSVQPTAAGKKLSSAVGGLAGGIAQGLLDAAKLPGDVYAGRVDPMSDEGRQRAFDLAGTLVTGGMPMAEAGAAGIFGGRLAKTADQEALKRAEGMAAGGADRQSIWDRTGWFQGADTKWRFEIPDNAATYAPQGASKVGEALAHPGLAQAYPDVAGLAFRQDDLLSRGANGAFSPTRGVAVDRTLGPVEGRPPILHEAQHAVQRAEGFAGGANPRHFTQDSYADDLLSRWVRGAEPAADDIAQGAFQRWQQDQYRRTAGEVEARNVATRRDMTPEQRRATPPWETQDVPDARQIVGKQAATAGGAAAIAALPSLAQAAAAPGSASTPRDQGEATPVGLAPGQPPVDPRRDGAPQPTAAGQAMSRAIGDRFAQAGEGVGAVVNALTRPPEGPRSPALPFSLAPAATPQDPWETPAGSAPGQPPVDPRRDGMVQPNTMGRAMQHAVGTKAVGAARALLDIGALPGDVSAGRTDPLSDEGIGRAFDLAGSLALGGMPMAERNAAGIFGGRLSRTADREALSEAQELAAQGIGRKDIWSDTGWFQGPDNHWRYEIPDSASRYGGNGATIGSAMEHPDAFAAYPGLAGISHSQPATLPDNAVGFYYRRRSDAPERIEIAQSHAGESLSTPQRHDTALHEVQHAIQSRERTLPTSNPQPSSGDYWTSWPEVEARNVERRRTWSDTERQSVPPWESADVPWPQPASRDAYPVHPVLDDANPIGDSFAALGPMAKTAGAAGAGGAAAALASDDAKAAPASLPPPAIPFGPVPTTWTSGNLSERIVGAESGGNATAKNPRSSATGAGQFIDGTWLDMVRRHRPDLANLPREQVLALRNDAGLSREMVGHYADENGAKLRAAGLPDTDGSRYLAHFAGPAGARAVLSADPSTPAAQVLQPGQVAANPFVRNMTAGQLADWAARKVGADAPTMRMPGGSSAPGAFGLSGPTQGAAPFAMAPPAGAAAPTNGASTGPDLASLLRTLMGEAAAAPQAQTAPAPAPTSAPFGFAPFAAPAPAPVPFDYEKTLALLQPRRPTR